MNNKIFSVILLTVGAAIGSAVTWKVVKTKYEQIANEEIASVKDEYRDLMSKMKKKLQESVEYEEPQNEEDDCEDDEDYPDDDDRDFTEKEKAQVDYYRMTSKYRTSDGKEDDAEGGEWDQNEDEVQRINGPYVITPEDFNCNPPGYNVQPLDYFADGILADDWGMVLDIEETIGEDSLEHFGEYDDDIVYVRNERKEIDYEVTKDPRTYQDALQTNPDPYYGKYET